MSDDRPPEPDREGALPHPREVYDAFGLAGLEAEAVCALRSGRMHHAWLITGPKGAGKATFAYRLTRRVLGAKPAGEGLAADPADPVCRRIEALSHPDFLLLRRAVNEKTGKLANVLSVDEARRAPDFFSRSAGEGGWRVCLVDAADDMNANAANALLKTLEEPPQKGLLILIAHAPGRLPSTIRSRCRRVALRPPAIENTAAWLAERGVPAEEAKGAAAMAGGAPGRALALAEMGGGSLEAKLQALLARLPAFDAREAGRLADQIGADRTGALAPLVMERLAHHAGARARASALEVSDLDAAGRWAKAHDAVSALAREAEAIYLDPRQTALAAFSLMREAAQSSQPA